MFKQIFLKHTRVQHRDRDRFDNAGSPDLRNPIVDSMDNDVKSITDRSRFDASHTFRNVPFVVLS